MNLLSQFQNNDPLREAVKAFMIDTLKEIAVERTFEGKDVVGIPEAYQLVNRTFDRLEEVYGIIEKPIINNTR